MPTSAVSFGRTPWAKWALVILFSMAAGALVEALATHGGSSSTSGQSSSSPSRPAPSSATTPNTSASAGAATGAFVTAEQGMPPSAAKDPTARGAVAVALAFERAEGSLLVQDPNKFQATISAYFAPEVRSTTGQTFIDGVLKDSAAGIRQAQSGAHVAGGAHPISYKVQSTDTHVATVLVWSVEIVANDVNNTPPISVWSTDTDRLEYTSEGWRLQRQDRVESPEPALPDQGKAEPIGIPDQMTWTPVQSGLGDQP